MTLVLQKKARKSANCYIAMLMIAIIAQAAVAIIYATNPSVVSNSIDEACGDRTVSQGQAACTGAAAKTCSYNLTRVDNDDVTTRIVSAAGNSTCFCACNANCRQCKEDVQTAKDFVSSHKKYLFYFLVIGAGIQVVSVLSSCCKKSYRFNEDEDEALLALDGEYHEAPRLSSSQSSLSRSPAHSSSSSRTEALREKLKDKYGKDAARLAPGVSYASNV